MTIIWVLWISAVFLIAGVSHLTADDKTKTATHFSEIFSKGQVRGFYRSIYFARNFEGPDTGSTKDRSVFANGGALHISTASFKGISANIGFYTVQDFGLNNTRKNTELRTLLHTDGKSLTSHENTKGFSVLGEYFFQGNWGKTTARLGAMEIWGDWVTPWTHSWPFRVIPATYEGVYIQNQSINGLKIYLTPLIWGFRDNNKQDFITPAEHLTGTKDEDGGISFIGLTYTGVENLKLQGWYQHYWDVFDNTMMLVDYTPKLTDDCSLILRAMMQFQTDVGKSLMGDHKALSCGVGAGVKSYGFTLEGRCSTNTDDGDLIAFRGGTTYTKNMLAGFRSTTGADLFAYLLSIGYDFGHLTPVLEGLNLTIYYSKHDYADSGPLARADMDEIQFDTKYTFADQLKGMAARFRLSFYDQDVNQGGVGDVVSYRCYLDYRF